MTDELVVKVDSHCHLTSDEMYLDVDEVIKRALQANVKKMVNICTDPITLERGILLKKKYPDIIFNTIATTPHDVEKDGKAHFPIHKEAVEKGQVCAVGETGLDYFYEHSKREIQKEFLRAYIRLAHEHNLPLIFHCRGDEAFSDLFKIGKEMFVKRAVIHCFTGNKEQADNAIELGWFLSVSGIITYNRTEDLQNVIKQVPLERLFLETDSPYLAPKTRRGKRNEPAYMTETSGMIAQNREIAIIDVISACTKNTCEFFQI